MKTIAERLKTAREWKGWKQAQLAVAAEVSTGTIGNIEAGIRQSKGSIPQIALALGVDYKWLATGEGEMISKQNQALAPVDSAQTAIKDIASMADCLKFLATYLEALDAGDRAEALRMVARLGNEPEKHASVARSIEGMASAAFARAHQKAA